MYIYSFPLGYGFKDRDWSTKKKYKIVRNLYAKGVNCLFDFHALKLLFNSYYYPKYIELILLIKTNVMKTLPQSFGC